MERSTPRALSACVVLALAASACGLHADQRTEVTYGSAVPAPSMRLKGEGGPGKAKAASASKEVRSAARERSRSYVMELPQATEIPDPRALGFIWPVGSEERITSRFGWRKDPVTGRQRDAGAP